MARLPTTTGDSETASRELLREFLLVEHNDDGTIRNPPAVMLSRFGVLPVGEAGADQTAAIQAVIDAHAGKRIVFDQPGIYHVKRLTIPSNTVLDGPGAILYRDTNTGGGIDDAMIEGVLGGTNIAVLGLELRTTVARRLLVFKNVTKLLIRDVSVTQMSDPANGTNWATWFINCQDALIDAYYQNAGTVATQDGLHFSGGKNVVIRGCRITSGDDPISLTLTDTDGHTAGANMENFSISNCVLTSKEARVFNASTTNTDASVIQKVTVSNITGYSSPQLHNSRGFVVESASGGTGGTFRVKDFTISDVTVDCSGATFGPNLGADFNSVDGLKVTNLLVLYPTGGGIEVLNSKNVELVNCESRGPRGGNSFQIWGSSGTKLLGCRSVNAPATFHHFSIGSGTGASDTCIISGCEASGGASGVIGFYLRNTHHTLVFGNRVIGSLGIGIFEDPSLADNNILIGNDVSDAAQIKLQLAGANTWAAHNRGATISSYTASNVTTDRTFDANATTIDELADVVGTLIADLRSRGLVG